MTFLKSLLQQPNIQKLLPFLKSFKVVYLLMVFVILYYLLIAADRYVSSISVSVRSINNDIAPVSGLASLVGINTGAREDVLFLKQYIHSLDMLNKLDKEIQIKSLYESQKKDLFFLLPSSASQESFLKFYQNRVKIVFDDASGLLQINVEGFSPQDAKTIAQAILKETEQVFANGTGSVELKKQIYSKKNQMLLLNFETKAQGNTEINPKNLTWKISLL